MSPCTEGVFDPVNWFFIPERSELCIIGELRSGCMEAGWYLFPANRNAYTMVITEIETVEIAGDPKPYTLLIFKDTDLKSLEDKLTLIVNGEILTISEIPS